MLIHLKIRVLPRSPGRRLSWTSAESVVLNAFQVVRVPCSPPPKILKALGSSPCELYDRPRSRWLTYCCARQHVRYSRRSLLAKEPIFRSQALGEYSGRTDCRKTYPRGGKHDEPEFRLRVDQFIEVLVCEFDDAFESEGSREKEG